MSRPASRSILDPFFDENDVRRLCGLAVYEKADGMQRAGNVLLAERSSDALTGIVRGVWRRADNVSIQTRGNRLQPDCARHGPGFCQHAGALLLHWLREPASVLVVESSVVGELGDSWGSDLEIVAVEEPVVESAETEIADVLTVETIAFVREIARRRGVPVSGNRKAEVVNSTAVGLVDPANIDRALAGLSPSERLLLDAAQLSSTSRATTDARAFNLYRLLGGEGEPPLEGLREQGLVLSPDPTNYYGRQILIPRPVVAQLPPLAGLAPPIAGVSPTISEGSRGSELISLLTMIAQDLQHGGGAAFDNLNVPVYGFFPAGFVVDPADIDRVPEMMRNYNADTRVRLLASPAMPAADVTRLTLASGLPADMVGFVARLMISLGIAFQDSRLNIVPMVLRQFLERDAAGQMGALTTGWLGTSGWTVTSMIFDDDGPLRFAWSPRHAAPHASAAIAEGVNFIARLMGRMPVGQWFDVAGFCETLLRLIPSGAPTLATFQQSSRQFHLTWHRGPHAGEQLILNTPEGWSHFIGVIVAAALSGPLNWLGLADVAFESGRVTAFRVRSAAGFLRGRPFDIEGQFVPGNVRVSDELVIVVPVGSSDSAALAPILQVCQLTQVTSDGLQYQLGPSGFQMLLEFGWDVDAVEGLFSIVSGSPIPAAARATLDCWQASYGQVRLYDELTLIELGDDLLLRELQAATSLEQVTIHQFSPRLVAVDDRDADQFVQVLSARGYAPRIVEGN